MKIAIVGAGGVGGYFGARVAQAGTDVHLLGRGEHLRALRANGLVVNSPRGDLKLSLPATDKPEEVGTCDWVFFCVKGTDTESAAEGLGPLLDDHTAVLCLQNGVDNEEKIARWAGKSRVVGGVAYIFSTLSGPGVIAHTGGAGRIVFGEMDGRRTERTEALLEVFGRAQVDAELTQDIRAAMWTKFVFICALSGMTAATRLPLGELRAVPETRAMLCSALEEVAAVGRAEGVALPEDVIHRQVQLLDQLGHDSYSSLHYDLTHGKPMELDTLHGTVLRLARTHGISTPTCEAIYGLLKPWAIRAAKRRDRPPTPG